MENILYANPPLPAINKPLSEPSFTFDLPSLIEKMRHNQTSSNGELNSIVLLKSPDRQIMLTALHEGSEVKFFPSND